MPLSLDEKIAITLTREEWAVVLIGVAHVQRGASINEIAERCSGIIQHMAAPVGVFTRVLDKHRAPRV